MAGDSSSLTADSLAQMKSLLAQAEKVSVENRHLTLSTEKTRLELAETEKDLKWLRSAFESSEKELEQHQQKAAKLRMDLEDERYAEHLHMHGPRPHGRALRFNSYAFSRAKSQTHNASLCQQSQGEEAQGRARAGDEPAREDEPGERGRGDPEASGRDQGVQGHSQVRRVLRPPEAGTRPAPTVPSRAERAHNFIPCAEHDAPGSAILQVVITKCFHLFCSNCIQRNLEIRHRKCPACGAPFGQNDVKEVNI